MTANAPASMDYLLRVFTEDEQVGREEINAVIAELEAECEARGVELKQVASGYRYQAKQSCSQWLSRLDVERPSRYSRALLETLALVVYRQPVTRAEIEDVRGVAVSTSIIKTLLEREWVRVVGHRDVPGKPALYGTTRQFLDYFNLKSLSELPPLAEIRSLDSIQNELELKMDGIVNEGKAANAESIDEGQDGAQPLSGNENGADTAPTDEVATDKTDAAESETVVSEPSIEENQHKTVTAEVSVEEHTEEGEAAKSVVNEPKDSEDPPAARAG